MTLATPTITARTRANLAWGLLCTAVAGVVTAAAAANTAVASAHLCGAVLTAVGLGVHGMTLNDLLDLRRDQQLAPERLLASGRAGPAQAAMLSTAALLLAMLGAALLGGDALFMTVVLGTGLLVYNAAARFIPACGLPLVAGLAAGAAVLAGWTTLSPWFAGALFTVALAVGVLAHVDAGRTPALSSRAMVCIVLLWVGVTAGLVLLPIDGAKWSAGYWWPVAAIAVLAGWMLVRMRGRRGTGRAAGSLLRVCGLWGGLHAATWCMAVGAVGWALLLAGGTVVAVVCSALLRELVLGQARTVGWR